MPEMPGDPEPPRPPDTLFARWLSAGGKEEDFEALCRLHPPMAEELRKLRSDWERFGTLLQRAGLGISTVAPESFAQRLKQEYGSEVDPDIALEGDDESAPREPASSQLLGRLAEHTLKTTRYQLRGKIAEGGMGAILKVWDEDLRRSLAMKVILGQAEEKSGTTPPVDRRLLARFLEEAQVTGQLDHPGIVPVHELGIDAEGRVYFTMKLVKGRDLKTIFELVFAEKEGWNETRALGVILKVCEAMAYAHAKGVVHRDLKPANIMVGSFGEVYVMDWGLARVLGRADQHDLRLRPEPGSTGSIRTERREERGETPDSPLFTMDGDVVGTPSYMPPEQARGEIEKLGPHSDVYAIGAVLYHLLARQMPYVSPGARVTNRTLLALVLQGPPPPLRGIRRDVPPELAAICGKAMERNPGKRYANTGDLARDLRAYLEGRVVSAYKPPVLMRVWGAWKKQHMVGRAGMLAVYLFATAVWLDSMDYRPTNDVAQTIYGIAIPSLLVIGVGLIIASLFLKGARVIPLVMQSLPILALVYFMDRIQPDITPPPIGNDLIDAFFDGDYAGVINKAESIKWRRRSFDESYCLAVAYCEMGRYQECLATLDECEDRVGSFELASSGPAQTALQTNLRARALLEAGDTDAARAALHSLPMTSQRFVMRPPGTIDLKTALVFAFKVDQSATEWLLELQRRRLTHEELLTAIDADTDHDACVRTYTREIALKQQDEPRQLNGWAWAIVRSPTRSAAEYERAVELARAALELDSKEWAHVNTLGVAEYRMGWYDVAIETLRRSIKLSGLAPPSPSDLAFVAMSQFQLGRPEEAQASLKQLRELMRNETNAADADNRAFLLEAESLIEGKNSSDG